MNIYAHHPTQTQVNRLGNNVLGTLKEESDRLFENKKYIVISDERIWKAAAPTMSSFMAAKPQPDLFLLPGIPHPYANDLLVDHVRAVIARSGAIAVAFGAGTINDVVKRASHELGLPYICVPTAPSVDGFAAFGAAITVEGFKTTLDCPAPAIIMADEATLAEAPVDLVASGYGDLIGKLCAGADWIIAEEMGMEGIDRKLWDMVQPAARRLLIQASQIRQRDGKAVKALYEGLIASGLAMQEYRDSRPASGAEHLLSHVWEMRHLRVKGEAPSHGFKVAVGTVVMNDFMRRLFSLGQADIGAAISGRQDSLLERRGALAERLIEAGPFKGKTLEIIRQKTPQGSGLRERREKAMENWEVMRSRALAQLPGQEALTRALRDAGCPSSPQDIGVDAPGLESCILTAALIRKRYTVLDLAAELGLLEELAAACAQGLG